MRPIKFRAWDKNAKKMLRSYYDFDAVNYFICPFTGQTQIFRRPGKDDRDDSGRTGVIAEVEWFYPGPMNIDLQWMQFTGLHDNNGKEIFEWDIVKIYSDNIVIKGYIKGVVEYMPNCAAFYFSHSDGWSSCLNNLVIDYEDIEIIGNIYENHELLENK